jgi:transposase
MMEAIIDRCAGLDVHQATVVACVLIGQAGRKPHKEIRTFSTMTRDLEAMRDWLKDHGVTHVGLESTGIYWKPVHGALEGHFELIVATAHHIKTVPGRKTDVKDAEWTAELVRHGLVKPSFVPPPPSRDLRDLVRLRRSLSETLTTEQNRTLKRLESANIKLASVVSEVFGVSGRAMLKALIENTATPAGDGGLGSAEATPQAGAAGPGAGRPADRASPLPAGLPPPAGRGTRGGSARAGRAP